MQGFFMERAKQNDFKIVHFECRMELFTQYGRKVDFFSIKCRKMLYVLMRKLLHGVIVMKRMGLPLSFIGNSGDDEERNTPNFKLNISSSASKPSKKERKKTSKIAKDSQKNSSTGWQLQLSDHEMKSIEDEFNFYWSENAEQLGTTKIRCQ